MCIAAQLQVLVGQSPRLKDACLLAENALCKPDDEEECDLQTYHHSLIWLQLKCIIHTPKGVFTLKHSKNHVLTMMSYPGDLVSVGSQHGTPSQLIPVYGSFLQYVCKKRTRTQ